jgi:hypothetical protein
MAIYWPKHVKDNKLKHQHLSFTLDGVLKNVNYLTIRLTVSSSGGCLRALFSLPRSSYCSLPQYLVPLPNALPLYPLALKCLFSTTDNNWPGCSLTTSYITSARTAQKTLLQTVSQLFDLWVSHWLVADCLFIKPLPSNGWSLSYHVTLFSNAFPAVMHTSLLFTFICFRYKSSVTGLITVQVLLHSCKLFNVFSVINLFSSTSFRHWTTTKPDFLLVLKSTFQVFFPPPHWGMQ